MSVFGSIKDFLFGKKFISIGKDHDKPKPAAPAPSPTPSQAPAPTPAQAAPQPAAPAAQPSPAAQVDIEAVLEDAAREAGQPLNWRTSIVDLMKLCGIDSSLQNRKELAQELGYTGDMSDSATMNVWLHKQVMKKLADSGGKVPAELKD